MLVFLMINSIHLEYTQEELSDLFLGVADNTKDYHDVLGWIIAHLI